MVVFVALGCAVVTIVLAIAIDYVDGRRRARRRDALAGPASRKRVGL